MNSKLLSVAVFLTLMLTSLLAAVTIIVRPGMK